MHACDPTDYYLSQIEDLARVNYFTKFDSVCLSETWLKDEISFITDLYLGMCILIQH